MQGIDDADSEIVAVVEIAEGVEVGAETVIVIVIGVGVGAEIVNVIVVGAAGVGVGVGDERENGVGVGDERVNGAVVGDESVNGDDVEAEAVNVNYVEAEAVNEAGADTVMVGVHCEVADVVEEGYNEDVDSAIETEVVVAMHEGIVVGVVIVTVLIGAETGNVGFVDDAVLVQIHSVYVIAEMRVGLGVGIGIGIEVGIGTSVVEAGFEILT